MSAGLMYRYFENKSAIVLAIIERQLQEGRTQIAQLHSSSELAAALLDVFTRWQARDPGVVNAALFLEMSAEATRDPQIAAALRALGRADTVGPRRAWMNRAREDGGLGLPPETVATRAFLLECFIRGLAVTAVRQPDMDAADDQGLDRQLRRPAAVALNGWRLAYVIDTTALLHCTKTAWREPLPAPPDLRSKSLPGLKNLLLRQRSIQGHIGSLTRGTPPRLTAGDQGSADVPDVARDLLRRRALPGVPPRVAARGDDRGRRRAGRLQPVRQRLAALDRRPLGCVRRARAAEHRRAAPALRHQAVPDGVPAHAADDVGHRARGARGRHGLVGRRAVHRQARLAEAAVGEGAAAHRRGAGLPRRALRGAVPDDRRLGHHAPPRATCRRRSGTS